MKTLLAIIALAACSLAVQAQTTTNLIFRVQEQHVTAVSTNIATTSNFTWDSATKKEKARVDGVVYAFRKYTIGGGTNLLVQWIRTDINDRGQEYANVKQRDDNALVLSKLTALLTTDVDLLTNADLSNLATIAAKIP
jgi:hypothetical protein